MPESLKMILVLTFISGAAGLGLSAMNDVTAPKAQEDVRKYTLASINAVLPDTNNPDPCQKYTPSFDNAPDKDAVCIDGMTVYRGRIGTRITGMAVKAIGDNAYAGTITVLVGLRMSDGMLMGIKVLEHRETPGLGTAMTQCEFQAQMVGKTLDDINWSVTKDGGDIEQLSGATITSRSVIDAISKAQSLWTHKRQKIMDTKPMGPGGKCDGA